MKTLALALLLFALPSTQKKPDTWTIVSYELKNGHETITANHANITYRGECFGGIERGKNVDYCVLAAKYVGQSLPSTSVHAKKLTSAVVFGPPDGDMISILVPDRDDVSSAVFTVESATAKQ